MDSTAGLGVERVMEVGGPGTFDRSVNVVRVDGNIGLVGVLTGLSGAINPTPIMAKSLTVWGIYVGSREMFADMSRGIEVHNLKQVIDQLTNIACVNMTVGSEGRHQILAGGTT